LNMVVPASLLPPVLDDLLNFGRPNRPARPWLGLYAAEDEDGVVVSSMARNGPAQKAGLHEGDRLVSVGGIRITDLPGLWRALWSCGHAGTKVPLSITRDAAPRDLTLASIDRRSFLKAPRLH
ncbi:MAG: serine protease, partial [Belnapia sp.]|nr:serine protease [Belnapia sp.]